MFVVVPTCLAAEWQLTEQPRSINMQQFIYSAAVLQHCSLVVHASKSVSSTEGVQHRSEAPRLGMNVLLWVGLVFWGFVLSCFLSLRVCGSRFLSRPLCLAFSACSLLSSELGGSW